MERDKIPYLYGKLNQEIQRGIVEEITIIPKAEGVVEEPREGYDGFSKVTIPAEENLIPDNIRKNTSIYGVTGTIEALYKDENLKPENLRDGVTVYADTIAETTGTMKAQTIDTKALIEGEGDFEIDDDTLTKVRSYAFYNSTNLTSFEAKNVTEIGGYAFYSCFKLQSFTGYNSVNVGNLAFQRNYFTSVTGTFGNLGMSTFTYGNRPCYFDISINGTIGTQAFYGLATSKINLHRESNVTELIGSANFQDFGYSRTEQSSNWNIFDFRGSTFTSIPSNCFSGCTYSKFYLPKLSPIIDLSNIYAFTGSNQIIYVPASQLEEYKIATNWSAITDKLETWDDSEL